MSDNRRIKIPFYPYLILLLAVAFLIIAGACYINFPSETKLNYSFLGTSVLFAIIAFACRPAMLKELFWNKKTALWFNDIFFILIIIGIGVLLSHIAFRRNFRYDFTRNKMFSLSDLTIKTIRELNKEVKLYAFFPTGSNEESMIKDLFKQYKHHSDKLSWVMIDPQRDPITSQRMNVQVMGTVIVECEANKQSILPNDLFYVPNAIAQRNGEKNPKFTGEQAITSAIANVLNSEKRVISVIAGHEESSIKAFRNNDIAALNQLLVSENFEVVENNLLTGDIDERAKVVLVISPKKDYQETELNKLKKYIENKNGNIIFAFDPNPNLKNLYNFVFKEYAVNPNYDTVVDPQGISMKYWAVAPVLNDHEITRPIKSKSLIGLFFHCCSLTKEKRPDVNHTVLMQTIENSWAKRNLDTNKEINVSFDRTEDALGPFELGIIAQRTATASGSRALILGDSDFMGNTLIGTSGNRDLILNTINWLAGNQKMISIRPRILEMPRIEFKPEDSIKILSVCVFGVPLLIFSLGIMVYFYRRMVK